MSGKFILFISQHRYHHTNTLMHYTVTTILTLYVTATYSPYKGPSAGSVCGTA